MSIDHWINRANEDSEGCTFSVTSDWKELIRSPLPSVRDLAIVLACENSQLELDMCLEILENDDDIGVRLRALNFVVSDSEAKDSYIVRDILRAIAQNKHEPEDMRIACYRAFLLLTGRIWDDPNRNRDITVNDIDL